LAARSTGAARKAGFWPRSRPNCGVQLAAEPSFTQAMLIRRAARALLRIELLDEKAAQGGWTEEALQLTTPKGARFRRTSTPPVVVKLHQTDDGPSTKSSRSVSRRSDFRARRSTDTIPTETG
jgi:hypothetical protein